MSKLHVHEKFINDDPSSYEGVIAEYELDNGNDLELWPDSQVGVFWINEFQQDGIMTTKKFDHARTYNDGIKKLVEAGKEIDAE